jgi:UDP-2,4-diacetamido-2,4,6-trideoxy-beta-L-altropyranose hydrolase
MNIAIRVDASFQIGNGHVMRCLALAHELHRKGAQVLFVCREHPGHLCETITSIGFKVFRLGFYLHSNSDERLKNSRYEKRQDLLTHSGWLGVDQDVDVRQTMEALQESSSWDWLIVDHYALDAHWESSMRRVAKKIMVIDDLADRVHDCDLLLDQNYFKKPDKRYEGLLPEYCETLLGPKYALVRPEFRQARRFTRVRGNGIARVLVYFGGNDPDNLSKMALEALDMPELRYLLVDVVLGSNNPHREELKKQAKKRPGTRLFIQPTSFVELLLRADLCIGAGGTTTWERLCLGLPGIVITIAINQESFTAELDKAGYVTWLGRKEDVNTRDIQTAVLREIKKLQENSFSLTPNPVDGFGALRVAEKLIASPEQTLTLRNATMDDMELFFFWVNDPITRKNSFRQEPIPWNEHVSWFENKLDFGQTSMWILQTPQGLPVGQIRFDREDDKADIGYSLDPMVRGRGWGNILLELGLVEFKSVHGDIALQGRVKSDNLPSRRVFQRLNFIEENQGGVSVFHWPYFPTITVG